MKETKGTEVTKATGQAYPAPVEDQGWQDRAREWHERGVQLQMDARELRMDLAEHLLEGREMRYYRALGYSRFEDFTQAFYGITRETAHQYIRVAENVLRALPAEVSGALTEGDNRLSLQILAALRFDKDTLTSERIEQIRRLPTEQQRAELLKLGYDRERMGGRTSSDLMRRRIGKKAYRDQLRRIQVEREKRSALEAEKEEMREEIEGLKGRLDQLIEAMKDPSSAKVLKTLDGLTAEVAKLKREQAEAEAEIATGKEVGTRALALVGELQVLCSGFERGVRIDTKAQWMEVTACLDSAKDALDDSRGRMAETIVGRMEAGEIKEFDTEDPGAVGRAAEFGLRKRGVRREG